MHAGCPVIVSNRGSLPEVVGDTALKLDPTDLEGWVEALAKVLMDRDYADTLARAGLEQAKEFTWRKTAMATSAIYHEVSAK